MHSDYTLVIPTYNRPTELSRLLHYLAHDNAEFQILVLDSGSSISRNENKNMLKKMDLSVQYIEYDEKIKPFDKFSDGVSRVQTPFCQLCADDDLVLVGGISKCIEYLRQNNDYKVAHGYYFMFLECKQQGGMDIPFTLYFSPSIEQQDPILRLKTLFKNYQALTYGVFSTPILNQILNQVRTVDNILARELLSSALPLVYGKMARLPFYTQGRSLAASEPYQYWHPLEWVMRDHQSLFVEYERYKQILSDAIKSSNNSQFSESEVDQYLDLIHLFYLVRHAPATSYEFLMESLFEGKTLDAVWAKLEVQIPLIKAAYLPDRRDGQDDYLNSTQSSQSGQSHESEHTKGRLSQWISNILSKSYSKINFKRKHIGRPIEQVLTPVRQYRLHEKFLRPDPLLGIAPLSDTDVEQLVATLDKY